MILIIALVLGVFVLNLYRLGSSQTGHPDLPVVDGDSADTGLPAKPEPMQALAPLPVPAAPVPATPISEESSNRSPVLPELSRPAGSFNQRDVLQVINDAVILRRDSQYRLSNELLSNSLALIALQSDLTDREKTALQANLHFILALNYQSLDDVTMAVYHYREVVAATPDNLIAQRNLQQLEKSE